MGLDIPRRLWLKEKDFFFDDVAPGVSLLHTHERGRERRGRNERQKSG